MRWYYSVDASTVLEITDRVRLPVDPEGVAIGIGKKADGGAGWEGQLLVDDPAGDLIMLMYRRIYCVQDAAPAGAQVVGNWFISNLDVVRMDPWSGTSRTWEVSMADENSLLNRRKFVGSDSNRPQETDIVRLRWALTTTELNVLSPDETYIDTTNPVTLDAVDLRTQGPEEMFMSMMQRTGKHYWIKYEEAAAVGGAIVSSSVANPTVITTTSAHGLYTGMQVVIAGHSGSTPSINGTHTVTVVTTTTYTIPVNVTVGGTGGTTSTVGRYVVCYFNMNTSDLLPSTISLSNDDTDTIITAENPTSLVYPLSDDARLSRAGGRLASGLVAPYQTGRVYEQDTDVGDTYAYVDRVAPAPNVTTLASATAQVQRQLAEVAKPEDEISTVWSVQAARLNLIQAGMIVPVHATHFPNYTDDDDKPGYADDFVNCRVLEKQIRQTGPTSFACPLRLTPMDITVCPDATPAGYYPDIHGFTADATGNVVYWNAGTHPPTCPEPGWADGNWGFPVFNVVDAGAIGGTYDTAWHAAGNHARCLVVGFGTLTVHLRRGFEWTDGTCIGYVRHLDGVGVITTETRAGITVPSNPEFVIEDNGFCCQWVDIEFTGAGIAGTRQIGFDGFTWAPV